MAMVGNFFRSLRLALAAKVFNQISIGQTNWCKNLLFRREVFQPGVSAEINPSPGGG